MTGGAHDAEAVFWNRVLTLAETMDTDDSAAAVQDQLRALEEGFAGAFDPVDAFPAYVTLKLCRSLQRRLERRA